jgi:hydrogenase maturation protein HypF
MACAWLTAALGERPQLARGLRGRVAPEAWRQVSELARSGVASPLTTSVGRLFDAVAALCGLRTDVNYEGQAAVELEAVADTAERDAYPLPGTDLLDARETILAILADLGAGVPVPTVSARFHNGMAQGAARACAEIRRTEGIDLAVLSGGVFQNRLLLERTAEALEGAGLRVIIPRLLPPNDGGIAFGQAAVAAARA